MKRITLVPAFAALALAGAALTASAQPVSYRIDTSHSEVSFSVRHFFTKVPGRFNDFGGTVVFDPKNNANSSVDVTIQAASIYTNHERRDTHLKSADFFEVEKFPTLTFKSTKVSPIKDGKFTIEGNLTMHGVTKPVVLDAEYLGSGPLAIKGASRGTRAGFSATTKVDRKDYGIVWNQVVDQGGAMLGDDVAITLNVEAIQAEPEAAKVEAPKAEKK